MGLFNMDSKDLNNFFGGNETFYFGTKVSSIFIIFIASFVGCYMPIFLKKYKKLSINGVLIEFIKNYSTGIIISTGFIHLLHPASEYFEEVGFFDKRNSFFPWSYSIALLVIFGIFYVEIIFNHFSTENRVPVKDISATQQNLDDSNKDLDGNNGDLEVIEKPLKKSKLVSTFSSQSTFSQLVQIFILEFGIVFHSIFVGLSLGIEKNFFILFIVLIFHQTFEGLGLGSRISSISWNDRIISIPVVLSLLFALSTPLSTALGMVINHYDIKKESFYLIAGISNSISAGILIYTGLIELMVGDFLHPNSDNKKKKLRNTSLNFLYTFLGFISMSVLAIWA